MLKVLDPTVHGVLDYALALAFFVLPGPLGFTDNAATLSYVIGVLYLGASLLTKYPLGLIGMIAFPVHGVLEALMAAAWIVLPWLFGFAADAPARNFYVIAGIGLLAVAALTDYQAAARGARYAGAERRRLGERRNRSMPVARERRMGLADRRGAAYVPAA